MTDSTNGAAAPPKKRSFGFKKAAWQTAPKNDAQDMFSHSNEFQDIVADETKRRNEKKKEEDAHKRKLEEERERKKRKASVEQEEPVRRSGTRSSPRGHRGVRKRRSKTPVSPTRHNSNSETLTTRYDSLTKSSSSSAGYANKSEVIDLGETDDENDFPQKPSPSPWPIPIHSRTDSRRESSEEIEEVDSPHIAALKAQVRARSVANSPATEQKPAAASVQTPKPSAIVQLLIVSEIPNTKPLMVKIRTTDALAKPKEAWCKKQGFTPDQTRAVFMTWKGRRILDSTKIQRLGIRIDNGFVTVEGDTTIYDDDNLPKIHVDAWTEEIFKARKEADALEAAKIAEAANVANVVGEPEPAPEPEQQASQIRLVLRAKGRDDFKIKVHAHTEIGHLANAYKNGMNIPQAQPVTLMFDGDRLKPMDTVEDADIDDMDVIEVHFK